MRLKSLKLEAKLRLRLEAVKKGFAAGRQFVADFMADRQAEVLQFSDAGFEPYLLVAEFIGVIDGRLQRFLVDDLQNSQCPVLDFALRIEGVEFFYKFVSLFF